LASIVCAPIVCFAQRFLRERSFFFGQAARPGALSQGCPQQVWPSFCCTNDPLPAPPARDFAVIAG
jgi:hypothetical protein